MAKSLSLSTPAPVSGSASFTSLGVPDALVETLAETGITEAFPIQAATLPDSLSGRDVLGRGRTGSGKTIAFALPLVARLAARRVPARPGRPRGLVLAPTRELATQIESTLGPLAEACGLSTMTVFGGVGAQPQIRRLRRGVDIVIACPGRLEDHVRAGHADLGSVEVTVLDEADHMADLGFLPGVRRLLDATPRDGQRLLFSATLDAGVDVLVKRYLHDPVTHSVDSAQSPVARMSHHVLHVAKEARLAVLVDLAAAPGRTVVFTRTKHGAKALARQLNAKGVPAVELHGNLSQNARSRNLTAFSDGQASTLVATDIAARGIHVDDVSLVVHADPPVEHKAYLHRSGRTARAGAEGTVVTLMLDAQVSDVRALTRKAGIKPTVTKVAVGDPLLAAIAPGERSFVRSVPAAVDRTESGRPERSRPGGGRSRSRRAGRSTGQGSPARRTPAGTSDAPTPSRRSAGRTKSAGSSRSHSAASFSANGRRGR
jgi:superfamily II DNA/RNA helicase